MSSRNERGIAALDACLVVMPFFMGFLLFLSSGVWLTNIASNDLMAVRISSQALIQSNNPSTEGLPSELSSYLVGSGDEEAKELSEVSSYRLETDQYQKGIFNSLAGTINTKAGEALGWVDPHNSSTWVPKKSAVIFSDPDPKSTGPQYSTLTYVKVTLGPNLRPTALTSSVPFYNASVGSGHAVTAKGEKG